ncbi:hypothetical protein EC973_004680 [Apophysomyces ossiformis]|uniref:protein-tyrosine-phosphatase n=1 Tax=Apophysomyces ossiformis TaxID=679940 RepID=A0A8H7ELC0_9FUNG|nr:hypothetical protein EC973_004680 [Apophysomyces ossiformis]
MPTPLDLTQVDDLCITTSTQPSSPNVIDILSAAFQTQTTIDEPTQLTISIPRSPRSSRMLRSAPPTTARSPSLRKCSSSHSALYRQAQEAGKGPRKRDSSGINLAGLVSAATNLRQRCMSTDPDTSPMLSPYRHRNSSVPNVLNYSKKTTSSSDTMSSPTSPHIHTHTLRPDEDGSSCSSASLSLPANITTTFTANAPSPASCRRNSPFHPSSPSSPRKLSTVMITNNNGTGGHRAMASGRVGKRTSGIMMNVSHNPHGSSNGSLANAIKSAAPIQPQELATMLDTTEIPPLVIDMRSLPEYDKAWIHPSVNVNLPTLLVKRYRRGALSNFSLQNFITSEEGKAFYLKWIKQLGVGHVDEAVLDMKHLPAQARFVVCDDQMEEDDDKTSHAWTLIGVLDKCLGNNLGNPMPRVYWLRGGFEGFRMWDWLGNYTRGPTVPHVSSVDRADDKKEEEGDGKTGSHVKDGFLDPGLDTILPRRSVSQQLPAPVPALSRSATIASHPLTTVSSHTPRRASVFTLDTSGLRRKKPLIGERGIGKSKERISMNISTYNNGSSTARRDGLTSIGESGGGGGGYNGKPRSPVDEVATPKSAKSTDDESISSDQYYTALSYEVTPSTADEYAFVISEIVPGFLYLGPEVSTPMQAKKLKAKSIRRILNMAEECDDDVPGLKQTFIYTKVAARDTIEMKDVDTTLQKAVKVIDESKKHHEPIYVHCKAGKSRSVAVILAYLVLSEHWTLKRAYRHVIKARPNASPNIGFMAELMKLEESVHGRASSFAGPEWQRIDTSHPPSPDTQTEIGKVQKAWRKGSLKS